MKVAAALLCLSLALPRLAAAQGLAPEDADALAAAPRATVDRGIAIQPRVMLQGVPRPRDQWRASTCVAWAVAYAAGSYFHRAKLNGPDAALSPSFAYALGNGDARCLAGSRISRMLDSLRDIGALPISEYAYDPGWCGRVPTEAERRRAAAFRIPGWAVVPGGDPAAAKAQLAAGRVVIFSMGVGRAFDAHRGAGVFDMLETGPDLYGHAMVALGYDDAMQAFRIQNSAGPGWGDGGQAWLSYRVWRERAATAYVITDAQAPQAVPAPPMPNSATAQTLERFLAALPASLAAKQAGIEKSFRNYFSEKPYRAFALNLPDGGSFREGDWSKPEDARQMVLERCQMLYNKPCVLFAEGDELRLPPQGRTWEPQDMPRVRYSGAYDLTQAPGLSYRMRQFPPIAAYAMTPSPKAFALHPWGRAFVSSGTASQRDAEAEALRSCNTDPTRNGQDGPCYLYAVENRVVLPLRLVAPMTP